jgi:Uma2 family endonuclease
MNEIYRHNRLPRTTQAAEGLPRRRWTTAELEAAAALGMFVDARGNDERFELIGGEVVPMSPKGYRHEIVRTMLTQHFYRCGGHEKFVIANEAQLNLAPDEYTQPDIWVFPEPLLAPNVRGSDTLLVVEVADSSLGYDLATKAPLYASYGVRDYWVINAVTLETKIFRDPTPGGYPQPRSVPAHEALVSLLCPVLTVKLADIRLA